VAFAHYISGDKKFAIGATSLLIIFLLIQPASFWGFQIALFKSDMVRSALNPKIDEFGSIIKFYPFYLYLAAFIVFFPRFSHNVRRLNYPNVLLLLYLLPSVKYSRYFIDIILPLMYVSFGREIFHILLEPYQKFTSSWKGIFQAWLIKLKTLIKWRVEKSDKLITNTDPKPGRSLKPYIIFTYLIIVLLLVYINYRHIGSLKEMRDGLRPIHDKSLVLSSFNLQYKTLFLRPDLRLIPSCEIGFATKTISREYIKFINKGILSPILRKTGSEYFLDDKNTYINPKEAPFLTLLNETNSFKVWKVLDPANKISD
jgi:hypothetical protein